MTTLHNQWKDTRPHYTISGKTHDRITQSVERHTTTLHNQWKDTRPHYTISGKTHDHITQSVERHTTTLHNQWKDTRPHYTISGKTHDHITQSVERHTTTLHNQWKDSTTLLCQWQNTMPHDATSGKTLQHYTVSEKSLCTLKLSLERHCATLYNDKTLCNTTRLAAKYRYIKQVIARHCAAYDQCITLHSLWQDIVQNCPVNHIVQHFSVARHCSAVYIVE